MGLFDCCCLLLLLVGLARVCFWVCLIWIFDCGWFRLAVATGCCIRLTSLVGVLVLLTLSLR